MNFRLSYKIFLLIKSFIWICYAFFLIYNIDSRKESEIIYGILLCGILIQMTLISFINNWYYKKQPLLLDWFRLATFFIIILNYLVLIKDLDYQDNFSGYIIKLEFILPSLFVVLIGLLGLKISELIYVHLYLVKRNQKRVEYKKRYEFKNAYFFFLLAIVVALIQIFLMLTGEVGYGTFQENTTSSYSFLFQIVDNLSVLILSIFAIFKYIFTYKHKSFNLVFIFFFSLQLIYGLLSGMKESIIVPIVIVLIPYLISGRKISKKYLYIGIITLLIIYPFNNNYRVILNNYPNLAKNEAFGLAIIKTIELNFFEGISEGGNRYANRLSLFPYLVYSVEKETEWTYYKNLDRYIYLPFAWIIPRVLIPDKPKSETGAILNEMIAGFNTNSLTPTTYGWTYFEGGYIYVFILFVIFGFFISFFQYYLGFTSFFGMVMYIGILVNLLKVESDIYFLISGILQSFFVYFIFYKFLIKENKISVKSLAK